MSALRTTAEDLTTALKSATFGALPPVRWVEDEDTGERVGWVRQMGTGWEWKAGTEDGYGRSIDDCLAQIEKSVLRARRYAAEDAAIRAEVDALPEPLRTLRRRVNATAAQIAVEESRNVLRINDKAAAVEAHRLAVMEYEAAERMMAEAA